MRHLPRPQPAHSQRLAQGGAGQHMHAVAAAGLRLVERPSGPFVAFSDRTWLTAERIRRAGAKIRAQHPGVDTGFRVFALQDDPDALILHKPLHEATQADLAQLQQTIATPQPAHSQRVLFNLLLAEGLPLSEKIEEIRQEALYRARDTLFILQSIPLLELRELLQAAQAAGRPMAHVSVFAPWVQDDNFLLGISTLLEHQGLAADRLHLRG